MSTDLFRRALVKVIGDRDHVPLALECTNGVLNELYDVNHQDQYGEARHIEWWCSGSTVDKTPRSRESTPLNDINDPPGFVLLPDPATFGTVYTFGYGEQNIIKLPKTRGVSRAHFRIYLKSNSAWMVADLSTNGTFVNNEAIVGERARTRNEPATEEHLKEVALNPQSGTVIKVGQDIEFRIHVINDPDNYQEFRRRVTNAITDIPSLASSTLSILPSFDDAARRLWHHDADRWAAYYIFDDENPAGQPGQKSEPVEIIRTIMRKATGDLAIAKFFHPTVEMEGRKFYNKFKHILAHGKHQFIDGFTLESYGVTSRGQKLYLIARELWHSTTLRNHHIESAAELEFIYVHIVDALSYLHRSGIVHGDVRPETILVESPVARTARLSGFSEATMHNDAPDIYTCYVDIHALCSTISEIMDCSELEKYSRGFRDLVQSGLSGPPRTSADILASFDREMRPSSESPFLTHRYTRRFILNGRDGNNGLLISVVDVLKLVRLTSDVLLDELVEIPESKRIFVPETGGYLQYCPIRRANQILLKYSIHMLFRPLLEDDGFLCAYVNRSPEKISIGDRVTLSVTVDFTFFSYEPSHIYNITNFISRLDDDIVKTLSNNFAPLVTQDIRQGERTRPENGIYIDSATFTEICHYLINTGLVILPDEQLSSLEETSLEHPCVTADHKRFTIIYTDRMMPPAFLLERESGHTDASHIRGCGPKFRECGEGTFTLSLDGAIKECEENGLDECVNALEAWQSGSRGRDWAQVEQRMIQDIDAQCFESSQDDDPVFDLRYGTKANKRRHVHA